MRPLPVPSILSLQLELDNDAEVAQELHTLLEQERVVRHVMERERGEWQQYHANLLDSHDKATRHFFDQLEAERKKVREWKERAETTEAAERYSAEAPFTFTDGSEQVLVRFNPEQMERLRAVATKLVDRMTPEQIGWSMISWLEKLTE